MHIIIDNSGYHLRNMGDVCMLQCATNRLINLIPHVELLIPTSDDRLLKRYVGGTPIDARLWREWGNLRLFPIKYAWLPNRTHGTLRSIERALRMRAPVASTAVGLLWRRANRETSAISLAVVKSVLKADLMIASGGGYLTDEFLTHANTILDSLELAQSAGIPTILLGQGIGPIENAQLLERMRSTLPRVELVALREGRVGPKLLRSLGVSEDKICVTGDDAIEPAHAERPAQLGSDIGINVRVADYSAITLQIAQRVYSIAEDAAQLYQTQLRPVPIDWQDNRRSDVTTLRRLFGKQSQNVAWPADDSPLAVIKQVGRCRLVVTGSYHAGVFALAQGIPVVSLVRSQYYIDKFHGLAEQFGAGCRVVDTRTPDLDEQLSRGIDEAWQSALDLRPQLLRAAERQIELGHAAYKRIKTIARQ